MKYTELERLCSEATTNKKVSEALTKVSIAWEEELITEEENNKLVQIIMKAKGIA